MIKLYEKAIEHYKSKNTSIDTSLFELQKVHHVYRTRRLEYWASVMLVCSLMPCFVSIIMGVVFCTGDWAMHPYGIRWMFLGTAAFCSFGIAPFVIKKQQNTVKEYNGKLTGKSRLEIKVDDFKNCLACVQLASEHTTNNKIICRIEEEIQTQKDKEAIIASLQSEYDILRKNTKNTSQDSDDYVILNKKYKQELEQENIRWAITNFFAEEFKHDWMSDAVTGAMMGVMFLMLWDLPLIVLSLQETRQETTSWFLTMIHSIVLPFTLGVGSPFIVRWINKSAKHKTFEQVQKQFNIKMDTTQYLFDAQSSLKDNICELQHKISLTTLKTIHDTML